MDDYSHESIIELGRVMFDNLIEAEDWKPGKTLESKKESEEKNFLALATEILQKLRGNRSSMPSDNGYLKREYTQAGDRSFQPWRFENQGNELKKVVKGTIMKWCLNNCNEKLMWCGRRNCLGRVDFSAMMEKERSGKKESGTGTNSVKFRTLKDFKIALVAMVSPEDMETLPSQFLKD